MAGSAGDPQLFQDGQQDDGKKRARAETESSEQGGVEPPKRTKRETDEQMSTCRQGATTGHDNERGSVEPAGDGSRKERPEPPEEGDSGRRGAAAAAYDAELGLELAGQVLGAALDEEDLPMAIDQPRAELAVEAAASAEQGQHPAGGGGGGPSTAEELSLGHPADAQATEAPPARPTFGLHASLGALAGAAPPAPSKQESALQPQCAIMTGGGADAEVSTSHLEPLPPREPGQQYHTVRASLRGTIIPPEEAGISWDHFPNFLGEGARARLLTLATLHLTPLPAAAGAGGAGAGAAAPFPAAVKELPANSNRVLLGAANNCELYQERVIRALAQKVGVPLLVADVYSLKLDEVIKDDGTAGGNPGGADDHDGGGPSFPPDPWDVSDEDDAFLGLGQPRADKKEGGAGAKDHTLDTMLAMRAKASQRRGMPGMTYFPVNMAGARPGSGLANAAAAAAAAHAAAERAAKAAREARERVDVARERALAAKAAAAAASGAAERAASAAMPAAAAPDGAAQAQGQAQPGVGAPGAAAPAAAPQGAGQQAEQAQAEQDGGSEAAVVAATAALKAAMSALAGQRSQQPAGSIVASGPVAPGAAPTQANLDAAAKAAPTAAKAGAPPSLPAASAAVPPGGSAAMSKPTAPAVRRGDRVSYLGRGNPSMAATQERLEQLNAAIAKVESSSSQRARDYLPQLMMRRSLMAEQGQRMPPRVQGSGAPPIGSRGRVVGTTGDKVQVVFDEPFAGGTTLPGQKDKCGFVGSAEDVQVVDDKEDPLVSSLQALFDVVADAVEKGPLIVFIQNLDRLLRTHAADHFRKLEALLATLPPRCLLFAGYCSRSLARPDAKKDSGPSSLSRLFMGGDFPGGGGGGGGEDSIFERLSRAAMRGGPRSKSSKGKLLSKMLPNHLELHPPNQEAHAKAWKAMVDGDVATLRQRSNRTALRKAMAKCSLTCDDWDAVSVTDCQLARKEIEQIVGVAVAQQLAAEGPLQPQEGGAEAEPEGEPTVAQGEGAAPMERCASAEVDAVPAAVPPHPALGEAAGQAAAGQQDGPDAAVEQQSPAAAAEQQQASAMQTDDLAELPEATIGGPAATTAAGGAGVGPNNQAQQPGADAEVAAGSREQEQQPPGPLCMLRAEHIMAAADLVRKVQQEAAGRQEKQALQNLSVDQYEKQLLSEVIPPEEINVSFDDIGALEAVKNTLHEVVILPLQRPELFTRGSLTKPTKGLLLFGPPGTGKTMLAKAVASESGAHFINVNMSAITSKWFGEGERLVRAVFGLAHKLSPSVIFVDEIDSFLSKRGQSNNEHEALRKMKNEFMTHWDGLRTKLSDRVLVLAATNRPMDLDDAVIRRMPRRIFVPLPDAANRERILQVILKDEHLDPAFDLKEAAALSEGHSGSDLKNVCIAAAYCAIREFLEAERAAKKAGDKAGDKPAAPGGAAGQRSAGGAAASSAAAAAAAVNSSAMPAALAAVTATVAPQAVRLRAISMADFKAALQQITASTHNDSATMNELQRWNDQFGEGGSRRKEHLAYFM